MAYHRKRLLEWSPDVNLILGAQAAALLCRPRNGAVVFPHRPPGAPEPFLIPVVQCQQCSITYAIYSLMIQ
jgi:hypothetical protein